MKDEFDERDPSGDEIDELGADMDDLFDDGGWRSLLAGYFEPLPSSLLESLGARPPC